MIKNEALLSSINCPLLLCLGRYGGAGELPGVGGVGGKAGVVAAETTQRAVAVQAGLVGHTSVPAVSTRSQVQRDQVENNQLYPRP